MLQRLELMKEGHLPSTRPLDSRVETAEGGFDRSRDPSDASPVGCFECGMNVVHLEGKTQGRAVRLGCCLDVIDRHDVLGGGQLDGCCPCMEDRDTVVAAGREGGLFWHAENVAVEPHSLIEVRGLDDESELTWWRQLRNGGAHLVSVRPHISVRVKTEAALEVGEHLEFALDLAKFPAEPCMSVSQSFAETLGTARGGIENPRQQVTDATAAETGSEKLLNLDDPLNVTDVVDPMASSVSARGQQLLLLVVAQGPRADPRPLCQLADLHTNHNHRRSPILPAGPAPDRLPVSTRREATASSLDRSPGIGVEQRSRHDERRPTRIGSK